MMSEAEARAAVLQQVRPLVPETVTLRAALGRYSARDLFARAPLPAFANSAMDGYAVRASDTRDGARLRVTGAQPAGRDLGLRLAAGEAIRIFTGAPLPAGADAVLMQEEIEREGDEIILGSKAEAGEFIRTAGSDLAVGQKMIGAGERFAPAALALLASQGWGEALVGKRARVAIVATGDELARAGATLMPGQIYESNSIMLDALVERTGAQIASSEHSADDAVQLAAIFRRAFQNDALLVSGGMSVGEHDLVKAALRAAGAQIDLWRVAIKPGKPFLFGRAGDCSIFGLPGNPVSAFVTFLCFVRPALRKMMGASEEELRAGSCAAQLPAAVENRGDRPHYLRGQLRDGVFISANVQESHALYHLSRANALLRVAPGQKIEAGAIVAVEIFE